MRKSKSLYSPLINIPFIMFGWKRWIWHRNSSTPTDISCWLLKQSLYSIAKSVRSDWCIRCTRAHFHRVVIKLVTFSYRFMCTYYSKYNCMHRVHLTWDENCGRSSLLKILRSEILQSAPNDPKLNSNNLTQKVLYIWQRLLQICTGTTQICKYI